MKKSNLKDHVESVLRDFPDTRNSDVTLTLYVWLRVGGDKVFEIDGKEGKFIRLKDIIGLPSEDKVSRIRRKFQEENKYPATDPIVIQKRSKERKEWVGFAHTGSFEE